MINLGISSACFYPLETEASLELIGKNGIKTTEIFFSLYDKKGIKINKN